MDTPWRIPAHNGRRAREKSQRKHDFVAARALHARSARMKTERRLQIAPFGRGARLALLIVVMITWAIVILGMLPEREKSSPDTNRTPSEISVAATLRLV